MKYRLVEQLIPFTTDFLIYVVEGSILVEIKYEKGLISFFFLEPSKGILLHPTSYKLLSIGEEIDLNNWKFVGRVSVGVMISKFIFEKKQWQT